MPSYEPLSPSTSSPTHAEPQRAPSATDPLTQLAGLFGNAFMMDQTAMVPEPRAGQQWAADPSLLPFYNMLNDPDVAPADRARAMLAYRNQKLAATDWTTLVQVDQGYPGMPLDASEGQAGAHFPLYERLGKDPAMAALVSDLTARALAMPQDEVDIQSLFEGTRASALELAGPEGEQEAALMALQAMATLMNADKFSHDGAPLDPETGMPTNVPEGVSPEQWAGLQQAFSHIKFSNSGSAAVLSQGIGANPDNGTGLFTADNNFHFWTHAWISAELQANHGLSPEEAEAFSAFAGAQYELKPGSFKEEHGNAGLKDILMNAEGAAFGSDLMADPTASLPGQDQGPPPQSRDWGRMKTLDPETTTVLDQANDHGLPGLLDGLLDGVLLNDKVPTGLLPNVVGDEIYPIIPNFP